MIGTLILTHGCLGRELVAAAQVITGRESLPDIEAVCLEWDDSFEAAREKARQALERLHQRSPATLILTDMYGGTPFNIAQTFADSGSVEVVTGVNVPMVLRLACLEATPTSLEELAATIQEKGRRSICRAGAVERPAPSTGCR